MSCDYGYETTGDALRAITALVGQPASAMAGDEIRAARMHLEQRGLTCTYDETSGLLSIRAPERGDAELLAANIDGQIVYFYAQDKEIDEDIGEGFMDVTQEDVDAQRQQYEAGYGDDERAEAEQAMKALQRMENSVEAAAYHRWRMSEWQEAIGTDKETYGFTADYGFKAVVYAADTELNTEQQREVYGALRHFNDATAVPAGEQREVESQADWLAARRAKHGPPPDLSDIQRAYGGARSRPTVREVNNNFAPGAYPDYAYADFDTLLGAGRDYLAGHDMPIEEFKEKYGSRLSSWQREAYKWAIHNPDKKLIVDNNRRYGRGRHYEWHVYVRGNQVCFDLPHHDAGGERGYTAHDISRRYHVNED